MNPSLKQAKLALNFEGYIGDFQMIFWNAEMVKFLMVWLVLGWGEICLIIFLHCLEECVMLFKDKNRQWLILFFALFRGVHNADKG